MSLSLRRNVWPMRWPRSSRCRSHDRLCRAAAPTASRSRSLILVAMARSSHCCTVLRGARVSCCPRRMHYRAIGWAVQSLVEVVQISSMLKRSPESWAMASRSSWRS